jgi:hypothetical protein
MEVKTTALNGIRPAEPDGIGIGTLIRVKVLKRLNSRHLLVSIRGRRYNAKTPEPLPSDLFIARVLKTRPRLELKFIRDLAHTKKLLGDSRLLQSLGDKKSFIQGLFSSDNFFKALFVPVKGDRRENKGQIQRSIATRRLAPSLADRGQLNEYLVLENLHNFLGPDSFSFLLPLQIGQRQCAAELNIVADREGMGDGLLLNIHLDDVRRLAFLIFNDYNVINCTLSTNNRLIEKEVRDKMSLLVNGLKSLKYDRAVEVRVVPYREDVFGRAASLKKIDVKM